MAVCICFSQEKEDLSGITIRILEDLVEEVGVGGGNLLFCAPENGVFLLMGKDDLAVMVLGKEGGDGGLAAWLGESRGTATGQGGCGSLSLSLLLFCFDSLIFC
jgi:hypothetical protein